MSRVEIKFWNVDRKEYAPDFLSSNLLVNENAEVFADIDNGFAYPTGDDFEPHFFKDGERIA